MSLISDADKAMFGAALHSGVTTFFRPLTVYQEAQRTVVVSDPNFNPIDAGWNQHSVSIENTPVFTTISGAIQWSRSQDLDFIRPEHAAQLKAKEQTNRACRLKVDASGYALLKTAKRVEIDGILLTPDTNPRPHGLFGVDRYTFYFVKDN